MLRALSTSLVSRLASSLTTPLAGAPWASVWRRGIITINVYSPSPHSHPADFRNEVKRNEDIAASKFNKMMRTEVSQGTAMQAGRRQKRYSRYTKPTRARRIEGTCCARSPPPGSSPLHRSQHVPTRSFAQAKRRLGETTRDAWTASCTGSSTAEGRTPLDARSPILCE